LATTPIRILVAENSEPFRRVVLSILRNKLDVQTILEARDGVEALQLAQGQQPDLILLDIAIPKLNGIEAARKIRVIAPQCKILFVSQESSLDIVQAAFHAGAMGYVVKVDAGRELVPAVKAILRGERFVGPRFAGHGFTSPSDAETLGSIGSNQSFAPTQLQNSGSARHEAGLYLDEVGLIHGFTQFIGRALAAGSAAIVVATESRRNSLQKQLQIRGWDIPALIEEGRYISTDVAETVSLFLVDGTLDPSRFATIVGELVMRARKAAKGKHIRVVACGEGASFLWSQGRAEAAIQLERLWSHASKTHDLEMLCGYAQGSFHGDIGSHMLDKICAEHADVHSW